MTKVKFIIEWIKEFIFNMLAIIILGWIVFKWIIPHITFSFLGLTPDMIKTIFIAGFFGAAIFKISQISVKVVRRLKCYRGF